MATYIAIVAIWLGVSFVLAPIVGRAMKSIRRATIRESDRRSEQAPERRWRRSVEAAPHG
jgi:hypothetical protein